MNDDMQTPERDSPVESVASANQPTPAWKLFLTTPKGKVIAVIVTILVLAGIITGQVYARPVTDGFVRSVTQVIPYPALSVNGETVTIKEFLVEYDALLRYFQDLGEEQTPPANQLEVAIADTLVNKNAIEQLANQYAVTLDEERVEQYYQDVVAGQESQEAFEQNLAETFEWSPEEFRARIVESIVLALQMSEFVLENEELQGPRVELVQSAKTRVQNGEDFSTVAKDVHAGFSGIESDLGYVKASIIPKTWASQVNALEVGQATDVIELPEGYAIFKLKERIEAGEDTQLHLLSITVPKVSLEEVVDDYLKSVKVTRYVGEE